MDKYFLDPLSKNGMDVGHWQLKANGSDQSVGHRMARYYNILNPPNTLVNFGGGGTDKVIGLEDPFVISSLIAGLAGVTLTIIIILSIWILRGANYSKGKISIISDTNLCQAEPAVVSASICAPSCEANLKKMTPSQFHAIARETPV